MSRMIYCEYCGQMVLSTRYRTLWLVFFIILCFTSMGIGILILYGFYCLCRTKRVCQCCKRRVRPYNNRQEYEILNSGSIYNSQMKQTRELEKRFDEAEREYQKEKDKESKK